MNSILIIEDDPAAAKMIIDRLNAAADEVDGFDGGISFSVAHSIDEAIAFTAHKTFDACLCDLTLAPSMNWRETLERIPEIRERVPVVAYSGRVDSRQAANEAVFEAGADEFITREKMMRLPYTAIRALWYAAARRTYQKTHEQTTPST